MRHATIKQRRPRDIAREQRKGATVHQCMAQRGDWTCLRPNSHTGPCFVADEIAELAQADERRTGGGK